eukprot:maker-scaffold405_size181423-snap-gene-0.37 protein:Tk08181 transcript:maker-scaffold405_size181423-snap-gene-0.37-mRNA-1 annotation:"protein aurora borealis isoform x1"
MDTTMNTPTNPTKRSAASTPDPSHQRTPANRRTVIDLHTPCSSKPSYFSRGGGSGAARRPGGRFPVRSNPFECNITMIDKLQRPVLSPNLFNVVQSPNSETVDSSGRFWSIDQQSHLFPVEISDDSPWKQETAHSILDADFENKTQEAINQYFDQTHDLKSPLLLERNLISQINSTNLPMDSTGASPILRPSSFPNGVASNNTSRRSSAEPRTKTLTTQYTQTTLSFPAALPPDFEVQLATYFTFGENQRAQERVILELPVVEAQALTPMDEQQNNLSTSRRKLFDCGPPDHEDDTDDDLGDKDEEVSNHWMSSPVKRPASVLSRCDHRSEDEEPHFLIPHPMDMKTPTNRIVRSSTWSSGSKDAETPGYLHRTSISPASMGSPTFSPIGPGNSTSIASFSQKDFSMQSESPLSHQGNEYR